MPTPPLEIRASNVETLLQQLDSESARVGTREMHLDLSRVSRIERLAGGLLSNALMGSLGEGPLTVDLDEHSTDWLWTSGLAFAIANRLGETEIIGSGSSEDVSELRAWRQSWRPGMEVTWREMLTATQSQLFAPPSIGETEAIPDLFGPTFAAFVDPHLNRSDASGAHPIATVIWPWLDRLLPGPSRQSGARHRYISEVGRFITETVANVSEHAAGSGYPCRSLAQVSITSGGDGRRLYLSVQDTGPGIATTARPKLDSAEQELVGTDEDLLRMLLSGRLRPWGRSRGLGLPFIARIAKSRGGKMFVATRRSRLSQDSSHGMTASSSDFDLTGTVVAIMLPIPREF